MSIESTRKDRTPHSLAKSAAKRFRRAIRDDLRASNPGADKKAVGAGATRWLLRVAAIRHAEKSGLIAPPIFTGGWESEGLRADRASMANKVLVALREKRGAVDTTEGARDLIDGLCLSLASRFQWLFLDSLAPCNMRLSDAGIRALVEMSDVPELAWLWDDADFSMGWIFSLATSKELEELDAKVNAGGKIQGNEIARKTQFFTDRYMVEWLVQNSIGLTWLTICQKNGWKADAEAVLPVLEQRRAEWRAKRDAGEVTLDALMPINGPLEDAWKYYVNQPIPADAVAKAKSSVRELKILDPAVGCGFFLFVVFDALVPLYREEARHRGESWSDRFIAESILENNLYGVDIDGEVVKILAVMLALKVLALAPDAQLRRMNVVSADLKLAGLPASDPHVSTTRSAIARHLDIDEADTGEIMTMLTNLGPTMGTLLKLDEPIREARARTAARRAGPTQEVFGLVAPSSKPKRARISKKQAKVLR